MPHPFSADPAVPDHCTTCGLPRRNARHGTPSAPGNYPRRRTAAEVYSDAVAAMARREEGEAGALSRYTDDEYRLAFRAEMRALAASMEPFTSDDVTARIGLPPSRSQGVVGALMASGVKALRLANVGMRTSSRVERHAARLMVWMASERR